MRPRACAAILRNGEILMVRHRDSVREYWTLPGGGVEAGETFAQAAVRETREETGLDAVPVRFLFEENYLGGTSVCQCWLLSLVDGAQSLAQGFDPEESHLEPEERLLRGVAWLPLATLRDDGQVRQVIAALEPYQA